MALARVAQDLSHGADSFLVGDLFIAQQHIL